MAFWIPLPNATSEFALFMGSYSFDQGKAMCENEGATLARISSREEFDFVLEEFSVLEFGTVFSFYYYDYSYEAILFIPEVWIGLKDVGASEIGTESDEEAESISLSTDRFTYVDGFENKSFFLEEGELPWRSSEPNNVNDVQNCVLFDLSAEHWRDHNCSSSLPVLCRRSVPIAFEVKEFVAVSFILILTMVVFIVTLRVKEKALAKARSAALFPIYTLETSIVL